MLDWQTKGENGQMNEADVLARHDPHVLCNKCKTAFDPYPDSYAPVISEVRCPKCDEPKILYFGSDPNVEKMLLSAFGANKDLTERLDRLENQIGSLKDMVKTSLDDARNIMTNALIGALNEQLSQHEKEYHGFSGAHGAKKS